jgi:hypothetical protein
MARKFGENALNLVPKLHYQYSQKPHVTVDKEMEGETLLFGSN